MRVVFSKFVAAGRPDQRSGRARYPEHLPASPRLPLRAGSAFLSILKFHDP